MLRTLFIDNFKALHSLKLKNLKKLNVFIGQNSSGKSSILQSIAFLAQSIGSSINYSGRMTDLGSFENTVFGHRKRRRIKIELSYGIAEVGASLLIIRPGKEPINLYGDVAFAVEISERGITKQRLKCPGLEIECVLRRVEVDPGRKSRQKLTLNGVPVTNGGQGLSKLLGWSVGDVSSTIKADMAQTIAFREKIDITNALLRNSTVRFNTLYYLSTTRAIKEWTQKLREANSFGTLGQDAISMLHQIYSNNPPTFRRIAKWIEKMGVGTLFSTTRGPESSILLGDSLLGVRSNIVNAGFGINQLISIIGECIASPQTSVIMIEEPEISLHPGAIGVLMDLFLETISNHKQILLSTHSNRLILELWARVKLGLVDRKDVALYLVEKTKKGVTAREIKLDRRKEEIKKEIHSLYEPRSPLEDLLSVAEESGDKDLSKKDLSEL